MSAIGGIVDFKNKETDFSALNRMRMSMVLRGRKRSMAFMKNGVGIIFNSSSPKVFEHDDGELLQVAERSGRSFAFCMDSDGINISAVSEKYFVGGFELFGCIDGGFAAAIYDGERDILILSRDRQGKKPLFYKLTDEKLFFASEVKGILDAENSHAVINGEVLESHLLAPMGVYRASNIYSGISEVLAGECVIFSRLGMSRFFYKDRGNGAERISCKNKRGVKERVITPYFQWDNSNLGEYLSNALTAFDYPQFDCFMPSVMEMFIKMRKEGYTYVLFEDGVKRRNSSYSRERQDRLGNIFDINGVGVIPKESILIDPKAIYDTEISLRDRFFSLPSYEINLLDSIFSDKRLCRLLPSLESQSKKTEEAEENIRILGMLCQTVQWLGSREFIIEGQ